jgi:hypothetical protein
MDSLKNEEIEVQKNSEPGCLSALGWIEITLLLVFAASTPFVRHHAGLTFVNVLWISGVLGFYATPIFMIIFLGFLWHKRHVGSQIRKVEWLQLSIFLISTIILVILFKF